MYLLIIFIPFLSGLITGLFGRKLGIKGTHLISCILLSLSAVCAMISFYEVGLNNSPVIINLTNWFNSDYFNISWTFYFDSLTVSILLAVLIVSSLVHIFSISYMSADPHQQRFFSYLSLFTFFILVLVSSNNLFILFVGWEFIGVTSFLLISFWFTRIKATKSAFIALLINRVGDLIFCLGFFLVYWSTGSLDFSSLFTLTPYLDTQILFYILICFFGGAIAKSAIIGLHNWLPHAMEGPTPVSSLIHAATLVTAGVYLILRVSPILEFSTGILTLITIIGSISCFYAACAGLFQNDLKRIIAFSTISQVAYMFIAIGLSQYNVAIFHLVNHAFFKALLFLSAGSLLHAVNDQQDLRKLGGILYFMPFTFTTFLIGSLSLIALPGLTGFYSKDFILELASSTLTFSGNFAYILGTFSAGLTAYYSFRLLSYTFFSYPNANVKIYNNIHDADNYTMFSLSILSLFSIFFGFLIKEVFVGFGSDFSLSLFQYPANNLHILAEFNLNLFYKNLPALLTIFGTIFSIYLNLGLKFDNYYYFIQTNYLVRKIYLFFNTQWFLDQIISLISTKFGLIIGFNISKYLDKGLFEIVGPLGLSNSLLESSLLVRKYDNSNVTFYALFLVVTAIAFSFIFIFAQNPLMVS